MHAPPTGWIPELFKPGEPDLEVRMRWGLDADPVLGFVGGLRPWHGVEVLPELLSRLVGRFPDLRLVIVGRRPAARRAGARPGRNEGSRTAAVFTGSLPHEKVAWP